MDRAEFNAAMDRDIKQRKRLLEEFEDRSERTEVLNIMDRDDLSLDDAIAKFRFQKALDWIEGDVDRGFQLLSDIANFDGQSDNIGMEENADDHPEEKVEPLVEPVVEDHTLEAEGDDEPSAKRLKIVEEEQEDTVESPVVQATSTESKVEMFGTTIYLCANCCKLNKELSDVIHRVIG